ncbi:hypothetical protein ABB37_03155 [Leptomonas pyrrhocoris]|uniref:Uncharacterized protein n=1 Tax=Leptomonas pyrrhocoris TaxID=157538 RepID=A0A0M9G4A9_LEPPY|nr:hypothetical protein ABB37_03153 [Leptomonas pyrrhocoris]XP_015660410.1 hypothetical protein ABB37_03155 [Leptomonas pyrrhocoris]KPA81967.1 hypothetical protein ABB37_03153 [Leptomonas pyrrhocoris]KPA81971.1 hypothetical protein ABB37_03155 [Leptomonas pyrrhocoris]|eukprot:XP_015660406.1 hypothetical protein ABB37_03153 [Leptomonas pyrrhocoris]
MAQHAMAKSTAPEAAERAWPGQPAPQRRLFISPSRRRSKANWNSCVGRRRRSTRGIARLQPNSLTKRLWKGFATHAQHGAPAPLEVMVAACILVPRTENAAFEALHLAAIVLKIPSYQQPLHHSWYAVRKLCADAADAHGQWIVNVQAPASHPWSSPHRTHRLSTYARRSGPVVALRRVAIQPGPSISQRRRTASCSEAVMPPSSALTGSKRQPSTRRRWSSPSRRSRENCSPSSSRSPALLTGHVR